ncbi:MAG TPA: SDR family NAD(P)-dependent oxidoreductase, partial [Alphaproteobacteria bacterium]|nr:SDR family NAD(P)-dependent oxidoreductase [Alphaproteobacteria bacterium]
MKRPPGARHVLITGASSGLGEALALAYAETGVRLALSGRDAVRLERVAFACRERGARAASAVVDATDADAMRSWIETQDEALPLDLAIANAGISGGTSGAGDSVEQVRRIFATNIAGVVNTIEPAAKRMVARGRGHLALMSSLAS